MAVTIREAERKEIDSLLEHTVETSWNDLPPALQGRTTREALERQIRRLIRRLRDETPGSFLVAIDESGEIAGHLWLGELIEATSGERRGYVYDLYVSPAYRRRGVAKALMAEAERRARRRGYREIGLTVAAHNHPARRLYESLGYLTERLVLTKPLDQD